MIITNMYLNIFALEESKWSVTFLIGCLIKAIKSDIWL